MNTRSLCFSLSALTAVLLAVGCDEVEERLSWAPDGSRAIMRVGDNLCLLDTNGNLSVPLASNVVSAAWLPDSKRLILLRSIKVADWTEAVRLLPREETTNVELLAKSLPDLLKVGLELADGNESDMEKRFFDEFRMEHPELLAPAILCALDARAAALDRAIQMAKDPKKLKEDLSNARTTEVAEVSVLLLGSDPAANSPHAIERTLSDLQQPRPSPSAGAVAFVRREALTVAPVDSGTNRVRVAERVEGSYDWTPDGKALVYAVRFAEKWEDGAINLVRIERRTVIGPNGELSAGEAQALAIGCSSFKPRVHCLPDGRVLFAAVQQRLPAPAMAEQEARFYLIDPALGSNAVPVTVPSAPGALPQDLAAFAPSPDGRQIAIVEGGSDSVAVLNVATGALEVVSPKRGWKSRILPAWRGSDELYFAALPESSSTRPELLRWHKGSAPQVLSRGWTGEAVGGLLEKPSK